MSHSYPLFRVGDEAYTFDRIGNMRNVQRHGHFTSTPTGVEQLEWYYQHGAGTSRLQTVLAGTGSALGSRTYTYDPSGNLYTDAWRQRTATITGRAQLPFAVDLATDGGHRAEYLYDAADQRVYKQYATDEDDVLTSAFHLRDAGGRELGVLELAGEGGEATGEWTWYAFAQQRFAKWTPRGEQQPAVHPTNNGGATPLEYANAYGDAVLHDLTFYLQDHLGNTRVTYTADCSGHEGARALTLEHVVDYYAYGSVLREFVNNRAERYLTTLHERDQETGLDYRGARYYDSEVGRFLSLDPLAGEYVAWSAYNYVLGNPLSFTDPTGRRVDGYVDEKGNYLGDDEDTQSHETRVISKKEWEAAKGDSELFRDGKFTDAGRAKLQQSLSLKQWHHSINITQATWSQLKQNGGVELTPYLNNMSSRPAWFKPGVNTPDESIKDYLAYPVRPGQQIYADIDGFTTYAESSAVRGVGNERVWKVSDFGRVVLRDDGVTVVAGSAKPVGLGWLSEQQSPKYLGWKKGDQDWNSLFRMSSLYKR